MASSRVSYTDAARWYCIIFLVLLLLVGSFSEDNNSLIKKMNSVSGHSCDEIYVVGEGETLHTISDKCGDPFIVEENPHIHDPDDVFPGLVIKITPNPGSLWVMEPGVASSFTKLDTSTAPNEYINQVLGFRKNGAPIIEIEDDTEILNQGAVAVSDHDLKHFSQIGVGGRNFSFMAHFYMETLLLL